MRKLGEKGGATNMAALYVISTVKGDYGINFLCLPAFPSKSQALLPLSGKETHSSQGVIQAFYQTSSSIFPSHRGSANTQCLTL